MLFFNPITKAKQAEPSFGDWANVEIYFFCLFNLKEQLSSSSQWHSFGAVIILFFNEAFCWVQPLAPITKFTSWIWQGSWTIHICLNIEIFYRHNDFFQEWNMFVKCWKCTRHEGVWSLTTLPREGQVKSKTWKRPRNLNISSINNKQLMSTSNCNRW